jgi:outer membrane protein assembly factor BamE (lipoprotein component of BamABCDE complex)
MKYLLPLFLCVVVASGCIYPPQPVTSRNSELTQGNVQLHVQVGRTTKAEILESFGAPNITTRDGRGREVWTYQRSGQASQSGSRNGYWTILFAGQSGGTSGFESSSRMITLIIKFDAQDVVRDFKSRTSNF